MQTIFQRNTFADFVRGQANETIETLDVRNQIGFF